MTGFVELLCPATTLYAHYVQARRLWHYQPHVFWAPMPPPTSRQRQAHPFSAVPFKTNPSLSSLLSLHHGGKPAFSFHPRPIPNHPEVCYQRPAPNPILPSRDRLSSPRCCQSRNLGSMPCKSSPQIFVPISQPVIWTSTPIPLLVFSPFSHLIGSGFFSFLPLSLALPPLAQKPPPGPAWKRLARTGWLRGNDRARQSPLLKGDECDEIKKVPITRFSFSGFWNALDAKTLA